MESGPQPFPWGETKIFVQTLFCNHLERLFQDSNHPGTSTLKRSPALYHYTKKRRNCISADLPAMYDTPTICNPGRHLHHLTGCIFCIVCPLKWLIDPHRMNKAVSAWIV